MTGKKAATEEDHRTGRERLLDTARKLFTRDGASNVGINDVIAAAGVAKMTLYNNFSSKDALIEAVYTEMIAETLTMLRGMDLDGKSEVTRILDLFDLFEVLARADDYRGCPFIHATLQAASPDDALHALVTDYKRALRDHVFGLLAEDRPDRADQADLIVLLLDGAVTESYLKGVTCPTAVAKRAVSALLGAA